MFYSYPGFRDPQEQNDFPSPYAGQATGVLGADGRGLPRADHGIVIADAARALPE
jgi:hypothetical protein